MRREIVWGQEALAEVDVARERLEAQSVGRGSLFIDALDELVASLLAFPFQGSPFGTGLPFSMRKIPVRGFGFVFYYTTYPSVDFQNGEALDVIYVLACRHERQGEPNWSARDPFRL